MNVVARSSLAAYWAKRAETRAQLSEWYRVAAKASWQRMEDVLAVFPSAKALNRERVRFEICGGHYRLIVAFKFTAQIAWVKFIGTHTEYDRVDALTVSQF